MPRAPSCPSQTQPQDPFHDARHRLRRLWHLLHAIALVFGVPTPTPSQPGTPERPDPVWRPEDSLGYPDPPPPRSDGPEPCRPQLSRGRAAPGTAPSVRQFPGPGGSTCGGPGWPALLLFPSDPWPPLSYASARQRANAVLSPSDHTGGGVPQTLTCPRERTASRDLTGRRSVQPAALWCLSAGKGLQLPLGVQARFPSHAVRACRLLAIQRRDRRVCKPSLAWPLHGRVHGSLAS